jgi:putative methanogen marker protein 4
MRSEEILSRTDDRDLRIGIGSGGGSGRAERSKAEAELVGFTSITIYHDPIGMAQDLREGKLDAAVRGDLDSNVAMAAVRTTFGVNKVLRAAFLEPQGGRTFMLAPVGIDEGWTVEEKCELARLCVACLASMNEHPAVGIMSGGRSSDRGRRRAVDRSLDDALTITGRLGGEGIHVRDVQILIEYAAQTCDVIIAPDGISGNLIFRTLHFLGGGKALGAPVLNIPRTYVDTSRVKDSYADSIALAAWLARGKYDLKR